MNTQEAHNMKPWSPPRFDDDDDLADQGPSQNTGGHTGGPDDFRPLVGSADREMTPFQKFTGGEEAEGAPSADFAGIRIHRETTLLTNAEEYAQSIRAEAELYVKLLRAEVDKLDAEAQKRYQEAANAKAKAEADAAALIEAANMEVDTIRQQAYQEGFGAGEEAGIKKRYDEANVYLENLQAIMEEMEAFRKNVAYYAEQDSVRLGVLLAKKVVAAELTTNNKVVWKLLAQTLATLKDQGKFKIWLSPADYKFAMKARPHLEKFITEEQAITFGARDDIPPGNAMIETDREMIDLTFKTQFHAVEEALNQALAERETVVLSRPASAGAPLGDENGKA